MDSDAFGALATLIFLPLFIMALFGIGPKTIKRWIHPTTKGETWLNSDGKTDNNQDSWGQG